MICGICVVLRAYGVKWGSVGFCSQSFFCLRTRYRGRKYADGVPLDWHRLWCCDGIPSDRPSLLEGGS